MVILYERTMTYEEYKGEEYKGMEELKVIIAEILKENERLNNELSSLSWQNILS